MNIELLTQKILIKILKLKKFDVNISVENEKKWDSINYINILTEIEKKFKIKISVSEAVKFNSYKEIIRILKRKIRYEK